MTQHTSILAQRILGIRISALMEMAAFFGILLIIDHFFLKQDRFSQVFPHPFWAIILLITIQYSSKEALLSALISSACFLIGNIPVQDMSENSYDYIFRVIYLPVLWITTATLLAAIRSRKLHEKNALHDKLNYAEKMNNTITQAYQHLKTAKEGLELRLAEERNSSMVVYKAAKALETIDQRDLLSAVKNIVSTTLNPHKFSLYSLQPSGFELLSCYGWNEQESYQLSFPHNSPLAKTIIEKQRVVCVVNEEDERLLAGQGIIAGPIIDSQSKEIFAMLKIEEASVLNLGMRNIEIFKILCEWIGLAYANARKYQIAIGEGIITIPVRQTINNRAYNARTSTTH